MPKLTDIIEACKKGESSAQCFVYEQFSPKMRALCYRYTREQQDVEDIVHDSFLWIFTNIKKYKGSGSFEGWMRRVFIGTAIKLIKTKSKESNCFNISSNIEELNGNSINDYTKQNEAIYQVDFTEEEVIEILQDLPTGYRVIFNLYVFEKYSHKEIANLLAISTGTSKSQLYKARKWLQQKLYESSQSKIIEREKTDYKNLLRVVI